MPLVDPALDVMDAAEADLAGIPGLAEPSDGFVMAVMHEGELQVLEAFGRDPATSAPLQIEHVFPFPAFTEVLVSTLAAALGEVGVVDLDAPISRVVPITAPRLGAVTLRQLLSHRAGLDNAPPRDTTATWETVLSRLNDRAMMTDPGILYSYSRYSYGLAVLALEAQMGTSVENAIRQTLLEPLGLESTSFGARDAPDALYGLPVTYTTVPDLTIFWLSAVTGDILGSGPEVLGTAPAGGPPGAGRSFFRGAWVDRVGDAERLTLLCGAGGVTTGFQVLPASQTVVALGSIGGLPVRTTIFALSRIGEALGVGEDIYGPRPLDGGATPTGSPTRCDVQRVTWSNLVGDFDSPVAAGDWVGRYLNGELQFVLEDRDGALVSPRGTGADPLEIHHFDGDTYFAADTESPRPFGFPIELFRDDRGRRYARVGERAYLHEADGPR